MNRVVGMVLVALAVSACKTMVTPPAPPATTPSSVPELTRAIADDAGRSDRESDGKVREALAADAMRDADACIALAPADAGCLYYRGVALGLDARAHPTRALDTLKSMLQALEAADAKDPGFDHAGPSRVRALVLIRAPGWPLGPGDADTGLAAAQKALSLARDYPPNVLTLAEALAKTGDGNGAQESYRRARDLAAAAPAGVDRDDWLKQADQGLKRP